MRRHGPYGCGSHHPGRSHPVPVPPFTAMVQSATWLTTHGAGPGNDGTFRLDIQGQEGAAAMSSRTIIPGRNEGHSRSDRRRHSPMSMRLPAKFGGRPRRRLYCPSEIPLARPKTTGGACHKVPKAACRGPVRNGSPGSAEDPRSAVRQPRFVKDSGVFCWPCATQGQRSSWLSAAHARKNWLPSTPIW